MTIPHPQVLTAAATATIGWAIICTRAVQSIWHPPAIILSGVISIVVLLWGYWLLVRFLDSELGLDSPVPTGFVGDGRLFGISLVLALAWMYLAGILITGHYAGSNVLPMTLTAANGLSWLVWAVARHVQAALRYRAALADLRVIR